ncbi:hypothetical protein PSY31_22790, partial [Shigella flexneri]|nr:hypothetical protein [Shigella flexneri]
PDFSLIYSPKLVRRITNFASEEKTITIQVPAYRGTKATIHTTQQQIFQKLQSSIIHNSTGACILISSFILPSSTAGPLKQFPDPILNINHII